MSDISELQARIAAALDRVGNAVEGLGPAGTVESSDSDEVTRLQGQLEEERTANAQLEERVRSIKATQDGTVERLTAEVARLTEQLSTQEDMSARLARVNAELRSNNAALRQAITDGVAEPHLVNKSMMAELEALRSAQAADRAELSAVLGEIDAMLSEAEGENEDA